ncbi:hypothetical protein [Arthrobacter sp. ES1]|uniref:hypothetical protein n=1 Tax=Arthrobacter sp. ES1 TaxID=1897056 RepID=UPI001CFFEA86|nr:hypothetical protein [Arthrobacter sp. ES1]MCB5280320.1 hypothetical protein [Arthrobacter sp. ES1]
MTTTHEEQLRTWAKGSYPLVAATELLLRAFGGRFAREGNPWVIKDPAHGNIWIDFEQIPENVGGLSGGERRFLLLTASLAGVGVVVELGEVLPGLDREVLNLVLAAVAHAGGSHEHSDIVEHADGTLTLGSRGYLPPLYPWPER